MSTNIVEKVNNNNNTDTQNNIFIKQSELCEKDKKNSVSESFALSRKDVANMIPKNCEKQKNTELLKTKTEWRWRIFKLPGKENETVEISQKQPGKARLYINKSGEWINCNVSEEFDVYVTHEYYHYA